MRSRITAAELRLLLERDPGTRLIDVRTGGEFEAMHIPGSYNVPLDDLDEHGSAIAAIDDQVVLVCLSGGRASKAESALAGIGMGNLHVLDGGITAWEQAGGDLRRGHTEKWSLERQIRFVAGLIVFLSVIGSLFVPGLKWVAAFVGGGLTFAAVSNICLMGMLLAKLPYNRSNSCDVDVMVQRLQAGAAAR